MSAGRAGRVLSCLLLGALPVGCGAPVAEGDGARPSGEALVVAREVPEPLAADAGTTDVLVSGHDRAGGVLWARQVGSDGPDSLVSFEGPVGGVVVVTVRSGGELVRWHVGVDGSVVRAAGVR